MIYAVTVSSDGRRDEVEVFPAAEDAQRVFLLRLKRFGQNPHQSVWSEGYLLSDFQTAGSYQARQGRRMSVRDRWMSAERRRLWSAPDPSSTLLVWKRRPSDPVPDVDNDPGERWELGEEGRILVAPYTPTSNAPEATEESAS
ncbi:hypothetical protein [Streptomyces massasporeus]|uniref:hypothetical protein n=1 Tax=Streptomyces massasporeus TaxID=67324 RepID=UPI003325B5F3